METLRTNSVHFLIRAVVMLVGALMLWAAPASVVGIFVMLIGLVCAIGGLTLEKTSQF
jgi:hypothetical protein